MGLFGGDFGLGDIFNSGMEGIPYIGGGLSKRQEQEFNREEATTARSFNQIEATRNREFQAHMSETAHQREVKDLYKAGLNPILSMNSGASTPSGGAASASSATSTRNQGGESKDLLRDMINMSRDKAKAEISKTEQDRATSKANEEAAKVQKKVLSHSADKLNSEANYQKLLNRREAIKSDFFEERGRDTLWMDYINKGANTADSVFSFGTKAVKGGKAIYDFFKDDKTESEKFDEQYKGLRNLEMQEKIKERRQRNNYNKRK